MDAIRVIFIAVGEVCFLPQRSFLRTLITNMGNKSSTAAGDASAEGAEIYLSEDLQGEWSTECIGFGAVRCIARVYCPINLTPASQLVVRRTGMLPCTAYVPLCTQILILLPPVMPNNPQLKL